jgi:hypothetical protein
VGGVLAGALLLCAGLFTVGNQLNDRPDYFDKINGDFSLGRGTAMDASARQGAAILGETLRTQCNPSANGFNYVFQLAWYNTITDGYDYRAWVQDGDSADYGFYFWGNQVFVRDEDSEDGYGQHRLVYCTLSANDWEALLSPHQPQR